MHMKRSASTSLRALVLLHASVLLRAGGPRTPESNEVVFKLLSGRSADSIALAVANASGLGAPRRIFRHSGRFEQRHVEHGLDRWYVAPTKGKLPEDAVHMLHAQSSVVVQSAVRPLHRMISEFAPADPRLSSQTYLEAVNMGAAWGVTTGDSSVVVSVVDSGTDMDHPDLQINKWLNPGEVCGNGLDDDDNGFVDDCHGYNFADDSGTQLQGDGDHGTHCAGIVAADSDNGVGVAGTAGGKAGAPGASLMTLTCFGNNAVGGFAEAIVYSADNGAAISSNSWGYTVPGVYDPSEHDAIDYFSAVGGGAVSQGGIVVFAAGNDADDADWYPAYYGATKYEGSVAVASTGDSLQLSSFSNYGSWVDIGAPGEDIMSTYIDGYGYMSGTSMACPFVSGVLALFMSHAPNLTRTEYLDCLYGSAVDTGWTSRAIGGGIVQPHTGLTTCLHVPPSPPISPPVQPPPPLPPSPPPQPPSMPPPPLDPTTAVTVQIVTDNFPSETSWQLTLDGEVVAEEAGFSSGTHETTVALALAPNYLFTISDSAGDGLCCGYGYGSYTLTWDAQHVIASGGEFGLEEQVSFSLPLAPSAPPMMPLPYSPPQPAAPSPAPSAPPHAPGFFLNMTVRTDTYPTELSWHLRAGDEIVASSSPYLEPHRIFTDTILLSASSFLSPYHPSTLELSLISSSAFPPLSDTFNQSVECSLEVYDSYGDGICCNFGLGYYSLSYDGQLIAHGSNFGSHTSHSFVFPLLPLSVASSPSPPSLPWLSPPPPPRPLPPPPPWPPLGSDEVVELVHEVVLQLEIDAELADFDEETIDELASGIAAAAGVDSSSVSIELREGSVIVDATISAQSAKGAALIAGVLSDTLDSAEAAGDLLGVEVLATLSVEVIERQVVVKKPRAGFDLVLVISGTGAALLALAALALVYLRLRANRRRRTAEQPLTRDPPPVLGVPVARPPFAQKRGREPRSQTVSV